MQVISDMLSQTFIIRALIVGILVSLCASLLGVSLVLKRYSMIGDGLSHVSFGTMSVAVACGMTPLKVSIPVVVLAAFLLLRITENSKIKSDAAIAVLSSSALAIGVIVTSISHTGINIESYMFGSILSVNSDDVILSVILSIIVLLMFLLCYNKIFAVTFDDNFAKATGVWSTFYNMTIAVLTAVTIVLGMRMMGAMLISSLIIFPALTSMRLFSSFKGVVISSGILAIICFCIGILASYIYETPAGASIVVINLIAFITFSIIQKLVTLLRHK